ACRSRSSFPPTRSRFASGPTSRRRFACGRRRRSSRKSNRLSAREPCNCADVLRSAFSVHNGEPRTENGERNNGNNMPTETLEFEEPIAILLKEIEALELLPRTDARNREIDTLKRRIGSIRADLYRSLTPWQRV